VRDRFLVAKQLDQLRGQGPQQVGLEPAEVGDHQAAAPVSGERTHSDLLSVAQSPYSCIAWTSRSISSREPELTTDLPSSCT
jgi:hypothetical protein